jgi:competence protein ComEC
LHFTIGSNMEQARGTKMSRIHFLDAGRGDTTILQFDNGRTYLIDYYEATQKTPPLDYLVNTLGVKELETVVITHPHIDHFRGIYKVFDTMPVRQVWLSDSPRPAPSYQPLKQMLNMRTEIRVLYPCAGTTITEGSDRIRVLAPPATLLRGTSADVNNASVVLKITVPNPQQDTSTNAILGADAEIASWQQILISHEGGFQADLLRVSHHGSRFGTDRLALAAIRPKYSVISVGNNPHGHPDPQTLELIQAHTSERVFRTDVDGTCVFKSDGLGWNPVSDAL